VTRTEYKALRLKMGMTQAQLGEALGITANAVARRERGERHIGPEAVLAIRCIAKDMRHTDPTLPLCCRRHPLKACGCERSLRELDRFQI